MRNWTSMIFLMASILMVLLTFLSTTDARFLRNKPGFKQARATRGLKGVRLQAGRGFGKRASEQNDIVFDLGNNDFSVGVDSMSDSFPLEWIVEKMEHNPSFARSVLRKFVDLNGDGELTMEELLRPTY